MEASRQNELNPLLRRIDNILAKPAFDELVELAVETCLTHPGRFVRNKQQIEAQRAAIPKTPDSELLCKLGPWGLRAAKDIITAPTLLGDVRSATAEKSEETNERIEYLTPESPIRDPLAFNSSYDLGIANTIEAVGKSIIDEAFICLGDDAYDKVREWHNASSREEKVAVLNWLFKRVSMVDVPISGEYKDEDEGEGEEAHDTASRYFYHPARLSPKFIGQFPDVQVEPTCLARSILIASFLEKADIPYMHCGVMESAVQGTRLSQTVVLQLAKELPRQWQLDLPDIMEQKLESTKDRLGDLIFSDNGFHAAIVLRESEQDWVLLDVNYNVNQYLPDANGLSMQDRYEYLLDMTNLLPGSETVFVDKYGMINYTPINLLESRLDKSLELAEIDDYLAHCSNQETADSLYQKFIFPLFFGAEEPRWAEIEKSFIEALMESSDYQTTSDLHHRIADKILYGNVFSDAKNKDISSCLARCKTDDQYRARRAEDLKLAPVYAMIYMSELIANKMIKQHIPTPHQKLELGMPHYRIGAAVLSDFSVYCGDKLPLSFWLTYWPSYVSMVDHLDTAESPHQLSLVNNHVSGGMSQLLQYMSNHVIISELLDQNGEIELRIDRGGDGTE